jgi:uncharacterized repeat protein (TIGR03803 family)
MDGGNPNGLMQETNGNFYGTTQNGGTNSWGTVFQMTPAGTVMTLDLLSNVGGGGFRPTAALVQGPDGALYGTTGKGGIANSTFTQGMGTIFQVTTNGTLTTLVDFKGDGAWPYAGLVRGSDGNFYGTTEAGGTSGGGTVFQVSTNGALTSLYSFTGGKDGAYPQAGLVQGSDGNFYGTTEAGGTNGGGTVFQISTNGALTTLHLFTGRNDGSGPDAGLVQGSDGNFYGTTEAGGTSGNGTVFQISVNGALTSLYSFTGGNDGAYPRAGLVQGSDGNFYGTTSSGYTTGYGTVFRMAPDGALVSLVQFDGYDGANPQAALTLGADGNFYGTTENGGADGAGVIFRVNINSPTLQISTQPAGQEAFIGANVVFSVAVVGNPPFYCQWKEDGMNLTDGAGISGSTNLALTLINITPTSSGVYSVLVSNATSSVLSEGAALGVIVSPPQITVQPASQSLLVGATGMFSVTAIGDPPLSYQWRENGTNLMDGGQISGSATSALTISNLVETNDGTYSVIVSNAVAATGSSDAVLTVFPVSTSGTTMVALHGFTGGNDGGVPNGLVLGTNGLLYGTTQNGGMYGYGTIFSLSTNGTLTTFVSFDGTNGATPWDGLTQGTNGSFYGTTMLGGSNSAGTIFSLTAGGTLSSIYSFGSNIDGIHPSNALALGLDGNFYGSAQNSSGSGDGIIFKMTPGGLLTNLYSFIGSSNGTTPAGALTLGTDGNFYGMTGTGGAYTNGNVFRMTPEGLLTNLYSFTGGTDGYSPVGQLVQGTDGNFYGATESNHIAGYPFYGTIFKITPGGALTTLYALNPWEVLTDGTYPFAGLIQGSDGNFYGTTSNGFSGNDNGILFNNTNGTVFQITPAGTLTTLTALNGSDDGAYPEAALVEGADGSLYGTTTSGGPYGQGAIFRITFTSAPQITTQPASQTSVVGGTASFNVTVFGAPPLFYQWRENGTNLADGGNVSGSAARVLTLNNITPANAATYSVIVSNALGSETSSGAPLTVEVRPVFQTAAQIGATIVFTWSATPGQAYQLQCTTNLGSAAWTNLGSAVTATNSIMGASNGIGSSGQKFYRVVMSP